MAGQMVRDGLLLALPRRRSTPATLVTRDTRARSRSAPMSTAIVMPMFHSQMAIAYNPALVQSPPKTYDELVAWVAGQPASKFGHNGIRGGMSGVAFVFGWVYANTPEPAAADGRAVRCRPEERTWAPALAKLKEFNRNVIITPGNAGTLDMLNRGEIAMGPVWVDMFYTWQAEGRLPPNMRLRADRAGHAGPADVLRRCRSKAAQSPSSREKFVALATSPQVQAEGIVKRFNWLPGIDAQHVQSISTARCGTSCSRTCRRSSSLRQADAGGPLLRSRRTTSVKWRTRTAESYRSRFRCAHPEEERRRAGYFVGPPRQDGRARSARGGELPPHAGLPPPLAAARRAGAGHRRGAVHLPARLSRWSARSRTAAAHSDARQFRHRLRLLPHATSASRR